MGKEIRDSSNQDLVINKEYPSGSNGNLSDDVISKIFGTGNQGGFRHRGSIKDDNLQLLVLVSNLQDPDWPDSLDMNNKIFTYYGDNKSPGKELHDTNKKGNLMLRNIFRNLHENNREMIPPIFIVTKSGIRRNIVFRGLAVPGADFLGPNEDLLVVWKNKEGKKFQNYKAKFSILNVETIPKKWIDDLINGNIITKNTPEVWRVWRETGKVNAVQAQNSHEYLSKEDQLPESENGTRILNLIISYFDNPIKFEAFAAKIFEFMDNNVVSIDLTRPWKDGGRDVMGKYRIGFSNNSLLVDFALEAKRYNTLNALGVKETSRLISRIQYRKFGVLITTSYIHKQALEEIAKANHPILCLSGRDIVSILSKKGYDNDASVLNWLEINFPLVSSDN